MRSRAAMRSSTSSTWAWIVTSSAVVGSSAISSVGLVGDRPWRSWRAGACRRSTRAGTASNGAAGVGDADQRRSSSIARLRAAPRILSAGRAPAAPRRSGRRSGDDGVERGHRVLEDHRDLPPRRTWRRALVEADAARGRARGTVMPRSPWPVASAAGPGSPSTVTLLPEPDSPTMPSGLVGGDAERRAVHGRDQAVLGAGTAPARFVTSSSVPRGGRGVEVAVRGSGSIGLLTASPAGRARRAGRHR